MCQNIILCTHCQTCSSYFPTQITSYSDYCPHKMFYIMVYNDQYINNVSSVANKNLLTQYLNISTLTEVFFTIQTHTIQIHKNMHSLVNLLMLLAHINYLQNVVVSCRLQRANVDMKVVCQELLSQITHFFWPRS